MTTVDKLLAALGALIVGASVKYGFDLSAYAGVIDFITALAVAAGVYFFKNKEPV